MDRAPRRQQRVASPEPPSPREQPPAQRQPQPWWEQLEPPQANAQVNAQDIDQGLLTILYEKIENLEKKMLMKGDLIDNLHLNVSAEVRQKIWAGSYVDLSILLIKNYQKLDEDKN